MRHGRLLAGSRGFSPSARIWHCNDRHEEGQMPGRNVFVCGSAGFSAWATGASAGVLQAVRERGHVVCGVSDRLPGLSAADQSGRFSGIEIEFCGAVAAAVFGERENVKFRPVTPADGRARAGRRRCRYSPRRNGVDTVTRGRPRHAIGRCSLLRWTRLLVPRSFGVSSVLELSGASICVQQGTGAQKAVSAYLMGRRCATTSCSVRSGRTRSNPTRTADARC